MMETNKVNVIKTLYQSLVELESSRQPGSLCTVVRTSGSTPRHSTSKMLVFSDGHIQGTVGGGELENRVRQEALTALKDGKPRFLTFNMTDPSHGDVGTCGGQVEVFVEPILPSPMLVILGGGHVGKAVAHLSRWLGFRVAVSDDRQEFCTPEAVPDADEYYHCSMSDLPQHLGITRQTFLVLATRGSQLDAAGLPALLDTPAGYIGVIGSRKRWLETCKILNEIGISDEQLKRVHSPIGIKIGAETPEEIAVSILAEIISDRENRSNL
jgi:xanthine dehydrogenase accessory factor